MKAARCHQRVLNLLVALAMALGLVLTVAAPASANVTAATVVVTPTSVNSAARYAITFSTTVAMVANVDNITVTFPTGTTVPASIPNNTVVVNGAVVDNFLTPAPVVVGRAISVTVPTIAPIGVNTIIFTQGAGILNPSRATTTARVTVAASAEPSVVNSNTYTILPTLTLSPTSGARGTSVTVTGAGYGTSLGVDIRNTTTANSLLGSGTTDASGNISVTVTIPNTAPAGNNALQATDGAGTVSPTAVFTVTPTLALIPTSGYPGTTVTLTGSAWPANSSVTAATVGGAVVSSTIRPIRFPSEGTSPGNTHTGPSSSTVLTDAETDFNLAGITSGDTVVNVTDGSWGVVWGMTATTLSISGLSGGIANSFSMGNVYIVLPSHTNAIGYINSVAGGQSANVTLQIPLNASPGVRTVTVRIANTTATASFEVVPRLMTVQPPAGNVGTLVTLSGSAMTGSGVIAANSITFGGMVATHGVVQIAADGSWTATNVPVPNPAAPSPALVGSVQVVVTDIGGRTATDTFTVSPRAITIAPPSGVAGGQIAVSGSGFKRNGTVNIQQPTGTTRATATADAAGSFSMNINTTWLAPAGGNQTVAFTAVDSVSPNITATVNYTVPGAAITLSPAAGVVGSTVRVLGTGFAYFTPLTSVFFGASNVTPPGGVVTDVAGGFSMDVVVPGASPLGSTTVTVTQGAIVEIASFTVTSEPPAQHEFGGTAWVDGAHAANGTTVAAVIDGVTVATTTVSTGGNYVLEVVQPMGSSWAGKAVSFRIGALTATQTATWTVGGGTLLTLTAYSAVIDLAPGWNFVSTPRKLATGFSTVSQVFGAVNTAGHTIWLYDNAAWTAMLPGDTVQPLDGIWVWSANATRVGLVFDSTPLVTPPVKQLEASWNAIGFSDTVAAPANSALASVEGQWAYLIGFNAPQQQYRSSIINNDETGGAHDEDNLMQPTEGYWLYMTSAKELGGISAGAVPAAQGLTPELASSDLPFPVLPTEFRGSLTLGGVDAPAGTRIVAKISGVERGSITTSGAGAYGHSETFGSRLVVRGGEGDIGGPITFYLNGSPADQTATYQPGQSVTLSLSATPIMANISGASVTLQGGARPAAGRVVPVTLKVFTLGASSTNLRLGTGALATLSATTIGGASNTVTFDVSGITPGTYDITIVSEHTLMNVKRNVTLEVGDNTLSFGILLEGDCDGSGQVAAVDFSILASSYLKSSGQPGFDARADFDRTGTVNALDFSLLAGNYLKTSPRTVA